jgi:hypothetical protein
MVVFSFHYISYPLKINTNKTTLSCTLNALILFQLFEFMNKTEIIFFCIICPQRCDCFRSGEQSFSRTAITRSWMWTDIVIQQDSCHSIVVVNRYSHSAGQLSLDRGLYFRVVCLATKVFSAISPPVLLVSGYIVIQLCKFCSVVWYCSLHIYLDHSFYLLCNDYALIWVYVVLCTILGRKIMFRWVKQSC